MHSFHHRSLALLTALAVSCLLAQHPVARAVDDLATLEESALHAAVQQVAGSVVRIETFGGLERVGGVLIGEAPTTGLIVSEDGYIVSSAYNFVQQPASILVLLPDGQRSAAEIVARDTSRMLVLLKVDTASPLPVPPAVPLDEMQVGQWSVAVGLTYDPEVPSLSVGILSALHRIWGKAIQTDAKISPSNYGGPLVDIRGRVLGILVPLSPDSENELAGAEWYDSGIGFAIPLTDIQQRLERFKAGDLKAGVLGVSLKGDSPYLGPTEIAACQVKSPAYDGGLRAGDIIVQCNGTPISRPAQLRHILGQLYAGDKVQIVAQRGEQRIEAEVELVAELTPYVPPFLGILPMRAAAGESRGVEIRYVFPDSGAEKVQLRRGDRIVELDGEPVADSSALRLLIANRAEDEVDLSVRRGSDTIETTASLGATETLIPDELPSAAADPADDSQAEPAGDRDRPKTGEIEIQLPEEPNQCLAYVPVPAESGVPYGVLVHLMAAGDDDRAELLKRWRPLCDQYQIILLAPFPQDPQRWVPTEVDFVRKALDAITDQYPVSTPRVAVMGYQSAGSMAYLFAFRNPELVHGLVAVDAPIPGRLKPPATDPVHPKSFLIRYAKKSQAAPRIEQNIELLETMKHVLLTRPVDGETAAPNDAERAELARWLDALDRM